MHGLVLLALSNCEPWCVHPCAELNGDVQSECGSCRGEHYKCNPSHLASTVAVESDGSQKPVAKPQRYGDHGNPIKEPSAYFESFTVGGCELESFDHSQINRSFLSARTVPLIIKGATNNWSAVHGAWSREELLRNHASEPFQLNRDSEGLVEDLLAWEGKYHMGHAVYPPGSCYSDPWRPYSPMMFGALKHDYEVPEYLTPVVTFQMGMGYGYGVGVPPENHPASWFAMVSGRKRWVMMPPDAGSSQNGMPGTEPPGFLETRHTGLGELELCRPVAKPLDALHCDQEEGDIIWVPNFWWHETCGLERWSIGIGGLSYDTCCPEEMLHREEDCRPGRHQPGASYSIRDIPSCASGERYCGTLPFRSGTPPAAF
jgi:hypothetical protein